MAYGLKPHIIEKISAVFKKYPQIERVILYGSRAKGNYANGSDIDLTIVGADLNLSLLNKIEDDLDDLLLPHTIDLSIFNQIDNKELINHIGRVGKDFYVKEKAG